MQTGQKNCVIEIRNLSKKYTLGEKSFLALDQVDLTVGKGEYIAIVGKSGSGKSTLLNLLGGIDSPTEGSILINGEDISAMGGEEIKPVPRREYRLRLSVLCPHPRPERLRKRGAAPAA